MRTISFPAKRLLQLLRQQKVATMIELKNALGTNSCMTIFRKLKELDYISSCSHSGKYYSLRQIAKFNKFGLWSFKSVLFSSHGSLTETLRVIIEESEEGYRAVELEKLLELKVNEPLLELVKKQRICREKILGSYVYFSSNKSIRDESKITWHSC